MTNLPLTTMTLPWPGWWELADSLHAQARKRTLTSHHDGIK